jgi:hypothetical protein
LTDVFVQYGHCTLFVSLPFLSTTDTSWIPFADLGMSYDRVLVVAISQPALDLKIILILTIKFELGSSA